MLMQVTCYGTTEKIYGREEAERVSHYGLS